jgi:hypothetical protein
MKCFTLWDTRLCSPLKVNRRLGRICGLHLHSRISQARNQREAFRPWRRRQHVSPKRRFTFNGLHGVVFRKIELFMTSAVSFATIDIVTCTPIARQRVAKHIPAEANARNSRTSIARQLRGKQALSTIQALFSVGSVQSGYKRVESRSWQFS